MLPQIIFLIFIAAELLFAAYKHGKIRKETKYNFWSALISQTILILVLYWGGFFDNLFSLIK
jgi:hypothetical protein